MTGEIEISASQTMENLLALLPGARRTLFAAYHVGGCQSCAYRDDETLAEVCSRNDIPVEEALEALLASHHRDQALLISPADLQERLNLARVSAPTREEIESFLYAKEALCHSDCVLMRPDFERPFYVITDAASTC